MNLAICQLKTILYWRCANTSLSAVLKIVPLLHHLVTHNQTVFSSSGRQLSLAWGNPYNKGHGMIMVPSNCYPLPLYPAACHALDKLFEADNTVSEVCCQQVRLQSLSFAPAVTCLVSTLAFKVAWHKAARHCFGWVKALELCLAGVGSSTSGPMGRLFIPSEGRVSDFKGNTFLTVRASRPW